MAARRKDTPIDLYLRTVSEDRRSALEDLRAKIRSVVPDAEECISYGMPAFRVHGRVVAGFQATRNGCSYYPFSGSTLATVARFIGGYDQTTSALHFAAGKPLPTTLVRRLIKARMAEIDEGSQLKRPRLGTGKNEVRDGSEKALQRGSAQVCAVNLKSVTAD